MTRLVLLASALLVGACTPPNFVAQAGDVRMVDPRTGIAVICPQGQQTIDPAKSELAACIAEMRHYGFGIEQELLAAHTPPPGAARYAPPLAQAAPVTYGGYSAPVIARPLGRPGGFAGSSDDLPSGRPWYAPDGLATVRP